MSNSLTKFDGDQPPNDHVYLYWDREDKKWQIWFADPGGTGETEFPMFKSPEFDRFDYKLHRFRSVVDDGGDTAWPLRDVLGTLIGAADHLLTGHDCDCHGYEEIAQVRDAARRIVTTLEGPARKEEP